MGGFDSKRSEMEVFAAPKAKYFQAIETVGLTFVCIINNKYTTNKKHWKR
jgi:hypothetical protein